ncbi:hypothetical protein OHA71_02705 [Streptomyces sp. NBC_00444]|uniref:hypothetical protein n=1 Tax=Streptomyces sp. NBC_00444 TaxID=2975744 RepID=UPI002E2187EA
MGAHLSRGWGFSLFITLFGCVVGDRVVLGCNLLRGVLGALAGQEGQGDHRAGDVAVPGVPAADLVPAQPGDLFRLLVVLLDPPPHSGPAHSLRQGSVAAVMHEEVGVLEIHAPTRELLLFGGAADEQVMGEAVGGLEPSPWLRRSHWSRAIA